MSQRVLLDTDPGHDDAIALLMAAASDAIDLRAVTTVAGNHTIDNVTANACKILTLADRTDIPVARGAAGPLLRDQVIADEVHGDTGLDGHDLPDPAIDPVEDHAIDRIITEARRGDLVVVPVGPLTNVALALRTAPDIVAGIDRIVLMGGAVGQGNITPSAEFNIFADPEAAAVVFDADVPTTMVGLDVTHQARLDDDRLTRIRAMDTPVTTAVADLFAFYRQYHARQFGRNDPPVHDACAIAQVIDSTLIDTDHVHVAVETRGEYTYGRTVADLADVTDDDPNTDVGRAIDADRFFELLFDALATYT